MSGRFVFSCALSILLLTLSCSSAMAAFSAPTSLTATAVSSSQINLRWQDNSSSPGESAFLVERTDSSTGPWSQIASTGANIASYTSTGLAHGTRYYYRVRAYRSEGNGAYSAYTNTASATTHSTGTIPAAPSALTASVVSSSQLNLTWSDNSANETGFKIERALAAAGPWTQIGTTGAGVRSYASTGLSAATTYYYRVRAYNTAGNSGYTNTASATTQTILPAPLPSGSLVWARAYGAGTADRGTAVALDGSGHVLVTGHFRGTVDFGGGGLSAFYPQGLLPTQYSDIFVAKYAATAGHQWSKRFGAQSDDSGEALAVDGSGNVVVTGWLASAVDLGCGVLPTLGGFDLFVAKYAGSDGHCLWAKRFGGSQDGYGVSVIVSSTGDVFVAGLFGTYLGGSGETATFGGGTLTSPTGFSIVLAKYAGATGAHQWSKSFPTGYYANGYTVPPVRLALAVDSTGNVVLTGYFAGSVDFGGGPLVSAGDTDIFLAKYAGTNGAHLWSKRVGSTGTDRGTGVALDSRDNVVVTGSFVGTVDFGGGALSTPSVGNDVFVAKYSASGAHVWSKRFGGTNGDSGTAVAVDSLDDLTVTGGFQGTVDFGGGALSSAGSMDIFVAKYTAGGSHLWSKRFGGTGDDRSLGVAMDDFDGSVVVTGYFPGTVDFGSGPLTSAGDTAIFLLKLAP